MFHSSLKVTILVAVIFISNCFISQVVMNSFEPEILIDASTGPYSFDFNGDGDIEFVFLVQDLTGDTTIGGLPATYAGAGSVMDAVNGRPAGAISAETNAFEVINLNEGDEVSSSQEFGTEASFALGIDLLINSAVIGLIPYQFGAFLGGHGFLGADFLIGTETHYGWIELSVLGDGSQITLHSYGYDATPNTSVIINTLSLDQMTQDHISMINHGNTLSVSISNELLGGELRVFSLSGAELHSVKLENTQTVVDLTDFKTGVYFVTAPIKGGLTSQKIFIH
tara:strand:- start:4967 stop:5812 length:846 start_codon:yes stop_codon:yes gene_type:complete